MDIEQKKFHFVCIFKNYRYICSRIKQKHNKKTHELSNDKYISLVALLTTPKVVS